MTLKPKTTTHLHKNKQKKITINNLHPDNIIKITTNKHLPTNNKLLSPFTNFNKNTLTNKSIPIKHTTNNKIPTNTTNINHLITLKILSKPKTNTINQILKLIKKTKKHHTPIKQFINHFNHIYTPTIITITLLITLIPPLLFTTN